MYYIIAETATDETEALDALNTVLFNRGVKELEDKTQLAGMLRDEYRREFFGEGQLFFYYKRLNVKVLHSIRKMPTWIWMQQNTSSRCH